MPGQAQPPASLTPSTSSGGTRAAGPACSTPTPVRAPTRGSAARLVGVGTGTTESSSTDKSVHNPDKVIYHFNYIKLYVRDLDTKALLQFINNICDPKRLCSLPAGDSLSAFQTAAEVHGGQIVPIISEIVSSIVRIMSSTVSLHNVSCSKTMCTLARCCIDSEGTEQEKSAIISSLCNPLSGCLMSTNESVSCGSAHCITALIQTKNWQFASHELINDVCFKVSESLKVVHCQTVSHLGLVVALIEHNHLTLEPYGRSLIKSGLGILDENHKAGNSQMVLSSVQMIYSIMKNLYLIIISSETRSIVQAMEQLQKDCIPEIRSDACQVAEIAAKLCSQMLTAEALSDDINMHSSPKNKFLSTPEEADFAHSSSAAGRKSGRRYPDKGCSPLSPGPYPLRRKLNYGEELSSEHHSLFRCGFDSSEWTSVREYAEKHRDALVVTIKTPGSDADHDSKTACNELKLITRRSYQLLDNCHDCGLTFAGNLSARNFIMDKYGNMKFDETAKECVKKLEEGVDEKDEDRHAFVHMIKREVFDMETVPSDLATWLFLVDGCEKSIEEVLKYSINLMDEHQIASTFTSLFDTLMDLEQNDYTVYDAVVTELGQTVLYSNWQVLVNYNAGNTYLRDTFRYRVDVLKKTYTNNPRGLLLMLRNSRNHEAKFMESEFARIVAEHFTKLLSDFQIAMHRQKCLSKLNLEYSMG